MLGGSITSLKACQAELDRQVGGDAAVASQLSAALGSLLDALDGSPALVRALANPNRDVASREQLVRQMMAGLPAKVVDLAAFVVAQRWSQDSDLGDAVEHLALDAALAEAEHLGLLEQLEAELFELDISLVSHRDLRTALGDTVATSAARGKLFDQVFTPSLLPQTSQLVKRMVMHPRGRGIRYSLKFLGDLVAARRQRLVAVVQTARPLSKAQIDRLGAVLSEQYGQQMQMNVAVDPQTVGGLRIRVGHEVVDGTVVARLKDLKRAIAA